MKKYVRERKAQMKASESAFLELVWAPGEAQADFGDVDVVFRGERARMHFFALSVFGKSFVDTLVCRNRRYGIGPC